MGTSFVNESKPDVLSRYFMLISENVDIRKVWPYVQRNFNITRAQTSDEKTIKDLLEAVIQAQGSQLYEDFMNALLHTYPEFYDLMQNHVSPTSNLSDDYPMIETNDKAQRCQVKNRPRSKVSTESSSYIVCSVKTREITTRNGNIDRIFHKFGEELNTGHFLQDFVSILPPKDAMNVLHGQSSPDKELFYIIKREIQTDIYEKFISFLKNNKPHIIEDISVDGSMRNYSRGIKRRLKPDGTFDEERRQDTKEFSSQMLNSVENVDSKPLMSGVVTREADLRQDFCKKGRSQEDCCRVERGTQTTSSVDVSKEDLKRGHIKSAFKDIDIKTIRSYLETHFTVEDLLNHVFKDSDSLLYECFMDALLHTYTDFHDRVPKNASHARSESAGNPREEENGDHHDLELDKKPEISQPNKLNSLKTPTCRPSQTVSPPRNGEKSHLSRLKLKQTGRSSTVCEDTRVCEDSGAASVSWTRRVPEGRAQIKIKYPSHKPKTAKPKKVEEKIEEPDVRLDFTKGNNAKMESNDDTMTHIIQRVQNLVNGSLLSFTLIKHYVGLEDAFHLGRLLAQHRGLENLIIKNNFITTESTSILIESITGMHRLVYISLCGQGLCHLCIQHLSKSLQNNTVLKELTLDNCRIDASSLKTLSRVLNKDSLEILSLNDNGFGDASLGNLMDSLTNAKSLNSLSLDRNGISDSGCGIVGQRLAQIDTPFTLSLEGNQISDIGAISLANILGWRSKTCVLNLAENQIGNGGAERLIKVWDEIGFTYCLDLSGNQISRKVMAGNAPVKLCENKIGRERAEVIARRVRNGETFNSMVLNDILLEDDSMKMITTAVYLQSRHRSQPDVSYELPEEEQIDVKVVHEKLSKVVDCTLWCGIAHLNVSNNALTSKAMDHLVELIKIDSLQSLDIGGNNFKSSDFNTLSEAVHGNKSLIALYLKKSNITDDGAIYIFMAMKNCMSLKHIDLAENEITGDGRTQNSDNMKVTKAVKMFNMIKSFGGKLSGGKSGMLYIASALKDHATIQHLNLRGNKVYDTGLKQLLNALPSSSLQSLNISNTGIGPHGAELFLDSMWKSNLRELDMSDNPIVASVTNSVHQIGWYLKRLGRKMTLLRLRNTEITDEAARSLLTGIQSQTTIDLASNSISDSIKSELKKKYKSKVLLEDEEQGLGVMDHQISRSSTAV